MSTYNKNVTCVHCGFVESLRVTVFGDFDGWDPEDLLRKNRKDCPFCEHAKKLDIYVPKRKDPAP